MTTATPVPHDYIVSTEFEGGEGVLVDLNTKQYYQLNETAMLVWRCLENRQPIEAIISEMTQIYDIPPEQAAPKIEKVVEDFQSRNLVGS